MPPCRNRTRAHRALTLACQTPRLYGTQEPRDRDDHIQHVPMPGLVPAFPYAPAGAVPAIQYCSSHHFIPPRVDTKMRDNALG